MKKMLLSLMLVFVMVFSCTAVGFAAVPDEDVVEPRMTSSINISVSRESGTNGVGTIDCNFAGLTDSFTIDVYLQKLSNGNWVNDTSNEDYHKRVYGSNRTYAFFDVFYDDMTYGTMYRLKVVSKTVKEDVTYQRSAYSATF